MGPMTIPSRVQDAIIDAYYQRALAVPDAARGRAQAAYAIAAAIATVLVGAGIFAQAEGRPGAVLVLGACALVSWLVAAGLFAMAVSSPFHSLPGPQSSAEALVQAALATAARERESIDRWQFRARWVATLAVICTVAAVAVEFADRPRSVQVATVVFTPAGAKALMHTCGRPLTRVSAGVVPDSLTSNSVALELRPGVCGRQAAHVIIARAGIGGVLLHDGTR